MQINVGSTNSVKVRSVIDTIALYEKIFPNAQVTGVKVEIEEFGHPKNLEQTIQGAANRAKAAFSGCDFSVGLESGLIEVPLTRTGYMEISTCVIYDGKNFYTGLGPAFEWPKKVLDMILKGEADGSLAFKKAGFTEHEKLGAMEGGIIGFLTSGRMTREEQTKQSIISALIQLENSGIYKA